MVGAEYSRSIWGNFSIYTLARLGLVFGDVYDFDWLEAQRGFTTTELQVGVEYHRPTCGAGYWFVRSGFEGQWISSFYDDDTEDMGLVGCNIGLGVAR